MTDTYPWLPLHEIAKYEPEMKRLKVSEVARSARGFLSAYKKVGGNPGKMTESWKRKRQGFIRRFMALWKQYKTERIKLALIAWAYIPR